MSFRIMVTTKGETGYLKTEVLLSLRTLYGMTVDENTADTFPDQRSAERTATKIAHRFDWVAVENPAKPWTALTNVTTRRNQAGHTR